jgi:hypothetical protein
VGGVVRPQTLLGGPTAGEYGGRARCGSDLVVRAYLLGWSAPGNQPGAVTPSGPPGDTPAREISLPPGSGIGKGRRCTCWPRPDDARAPRRPATGAAGRAWTVAGRSTATAATCSYLEHGSGPLAGELDRLWRAKGTMRGGIVRERAQP